jgi:hypothetical protein
MLLAGIPGFWTLSITAILSRMQCFRKVGISVLRLKGWETAFVQEQSAYWKMDVILNVLKIVLNEDFSQFPVL